MKLNEISRTAVSTWCPLPTYSNYMAAGSIAGYLEDFSSELKLEIFNTDPVSRKRHEPITETENTLIGKVTIPDRFNRLAWGKPNNDYEMGIIAGSMIDGSITLYDASKIVGSNGGEYVVWCVCVCVCAFSSIFFFSIYCFRQILCWSDDVILTCKNIDSNNNQRTNELIIQINRCHRVHAREAFRLSQGTRIQSFTVQFIGICR